MDRLRELRDAGKVEWIEEMAAWAGQLDDIVRALADEGFQECRKEIVRSRRDRQPAGGQGFQGGLRASGGPVSSSEARPGVFCRGAFDGARGLPVSPGVSPRLYFTNPSAQAFAPPPPSCYSSPSV